MVWGGRRLGEQFGKALPRDEPYGESWEVSAHPLHVSRVAEGPFRGATLTDLTAERPRELFGGRDEPPEVFPLLVKLLDAESLLSVQVHPDDETARRLSGEQRGKTEAWAVLDVSPGGRIYAGLKPGVRRHDLEVALDEGNVEACLHSFTPVAGDFVFLRAGTVHAVGGGVVLAEVQQTSDVTLRLFDWNRKGPDGQSRPLHVRESLEAINWSAAGPVDAGTCTPIEGLSWDVAGERLVSCPYFNLDRYRLQGPFQTPDPGRLTIWQVLDGSAELRGEGVSYRRVFTCGETVVIPASCGPTSWRPCDPSQSSPSATLLTTSLP
jgi:mannose-6-phosphate isomerase